MRLTFLSTMRWKLGFITVSLTLIFILSCVPPSQQNEKSAVAGLAISNGCYDADGDGYGRSGYLITTCTGSRTKFDCNDQNRTINPRAQEICGNGKDDNCDGQVDGGCVQCNDSDGGNNPLFGGVVTQINASGSSHTSTDFCYRAYGREILQERVCVQQEIYYGSVQDNVRVNCSSLNLSFTCIDPDDFIGPTPAYCGPGVS